MRLSSARPFRVSLVAPAAFTLVTVGIATWAAGPETSAKPAQSPRAAGLGPRAAAVEKPPPRFEDTGRISALRQEIAASPDPDTAAALGDLLLLAGRETEAAQAFGTARALLAKQGAALRMEVAKEGSVNSLAWQGDTLALTRSLSPMRRSHQLLGTRLEIWEAAGGRDQGWAPRLERTIPGAGPRTAWAGPGRLWWQAGTDLVLVDARSGRPVRSLSLGHAQTAQRPWYAASLAVAARSGHVAAVVHAQLVRVWTAAGALAREVKLTGSSPQTIRANMGDHCEMRTVQMPVEVGKLALDPAGKRLAVAASDGRIRVVELATGRERLLKQEWEPMRYGPPRNPFARERAIVLRFSTDGRRLRLVQADSSVTTWDAASGRRVSRWQVPCPEASEAAVRGRLAKEGRRVDTWSLRHAQSEAREGCFNIRGADLSPDGKTLATARNTISLFSIPSGARRPGPKVEYSSEVALGPKERALAATKLYHGAEVWSLSPLARRGRLERPTVRGQIADLSPDGRFLAVWHGEESWIQDREVTLWDTRAGTRIGSVTAWTVDAVRFAIQRTPRFTWPAGGARGAAGTGAGGGAAAGMAGAPARGRSAGPGSQTVLVVGRADRVEVYSLAPFRLATTLATGLAARSGFAVAPRDERVVIAGFPDGKLRLTFLGGGKLELLPERVTVSPVTLSPPPLAISEDGQRLVAASDDGVRVWNLATRHLLGHHAARQVPQPTYPSRWRRGRGRYGAPARAPRPAPAPLVTLRPKAVALSHDGRLLALSENQGHAVRILDATSGRELGRFTTSLDPDALCFAPGDQELIVAGIGLFGRWRFPRPGPGWAPARAPAMAPGMAPAGMPGTTPGMAPGSTPPRAGATTTAATAASALVPIQAEGRHLSPRRLALGAWGRALVAYDFYHRAITFWSVGSYRLAGDLWPVSGGHWVALSSAGRVDASPLGRHALVTLAHSTGGKQETGYSWGLGWGSLREADLLHRAATGRLAAP